MFEENAVLSMRFPQKLWRIVNDCKSGAIAWGMNGLTVLLDYKKFQEEYLDSERPVFKTRNITSFIRQLNLYGFRKVTSRGPGNLSRNPDVHEFLHDDFQAGRLDLLVRVCRKAVTKHKNAAKRPRSAQKRDEFADKTEESRGTRLSRLQICQLALTKTLEQYTREYRQEKYFDGINNYASVLQAEENRQIRPVLYNFGICLTPVEEASVQWAEQQKCNCHCLRHAN